MRVNPNPMPDLLAALNQTELEEQQAELQISTGQERERALRQSDRRCAAGREQRSGYFQRRISAEHQRGAGPALDREFDAEFGHNRAATGPQPGRRGANGTLSASDQAAIANQLQGIQSQLVSLANTTYEGNYMFRRHHGRIRRHTWWTDTSPSGVDYVGNTGVNEVSIGNGYKLAVNQPGSQLFSAAAMTFFWPSTTSFQAVQTNTGIRTAVNAVSAASSYLSAQTVFYGNADGPDAVRDHLPQCRPVANQPAAEHAGRGTWLRPPPISPRLKPITRPRLRPSASFRRIISSVI
jgi:flagellar hook-associated protein 3 FlgL